MKLNDRMFPRVAERFKALGEPAGLRILDALREGELTVADLVERTTLNQANLSQHLQLLHGLGFVERRKDGLFVYYRPRGRARFSALRQHVSEAVMPVYNGQRALGRIRPTTC